MARKHSPFLALKFRDFKLFFWGSFISQLGTQMQTVAVAWQVYLLTRSPASLGLIGLSNILPVILFSLVGGVAADRLDRKNLLIVCQVALAVLGLVLYLQTHLGLISPLIIYFILGGIALVNSFGMPARQSILPHLVPKEYFINAVSLNTMQRQSAIIAGPAIAGFIIAAFGVGAIYLFNAITFIILVLALLPISVPPIDKKRVVSFSLESIKEGINFVRHSEIIKSTMILDFLANFLGTANILMPVFAKDILKVGAEGLGFLYAAPAVGGVAAGLYFSGKHKIKNQGRIVIHAVVIYGLAIVGFGLSRNFLVSLFFLSIMGMGDMISTIIRNTLRQLLTPDYIRGRMVSINMIFVQGGPQLGDMEAGFLANFIGAPITTVIGGVGVVLISLLVWKEIPSLREYQGDELLN